MKPHLRNLIILFVVITLGLEIVIPYFPDLQNKQTLRISLHTYNMLALLINGYFSKLTFRNNLENNPNKFVRDVSKSIFLRLFFMIFLFIILLIFNKLDMKLFTYSFLIIYFIYGAFEIRFLVSNLRPVSKHNKIN